MSDQTYREREREAALAEILPEIGPAIQRAAYRWTASDADADDAYADAVAALWRQGPLDDAENARAYALVCVRNWAWKSSAADRASRPPSCQTQCSPRASIGAKRIPSWSPSFARASGA